MPLVDAAILQEAEKHRFDFGPLRAWGSVGFIVMALIGGAMVDWRTAQQDVAATATLWALAMIVVIYGAQTVVALEFPRLEA